MAEEQLESLQRGGLVILQRRDAFRFGTDSVLLADFARIAPGDRVADFGTGTGVLPLLCVGRGKGARYDALELQPEMADMARRSVALNHLENRIAVHCLDVADAPATLPRGAYHHVLCNPPYGQPGTTLHSPEAGVDIARHQSEAGLADWFRSAHRLLRGHGRISLVYPAPRMLALMDALRAAHLEPKRFQLVYPRADRPASHVLLEAVKDARPMLHPEPPLILREADGRETAALRRIYGEEAV